MRIIVCLIGAALSVEAIFALKQSSQKEELVCIAHEYVPDIKKVSILVPNVIPIYFFVEEFVFEKCVYKTSFGTRPAYQSCWVKPLFRKPRDDPSHVLFEAGIALR